MKRKIFLAGLIVTSLVIHVSAQDSWKPEEIQAGFYSPKRIGHLWDTWVYYYKGKWYQYYLAGYPGKWDSFELMTSDDGVRWKEVGKMLEPRQGTTWMGTGHIIEAPGFKDHPSWIMNYSEWFGDKQDIMFATSDDLVRWKKVDEKYRFVQDERWYKPKGRWDCIDCVKICDTLYYGYFTADPDPEKISGEVCGFGFAKSRDGISWQALPPVGGNMTGELGGIQKIADKYYITVSEGRIASSSSPEGPFIAQEKNPNMFGKGCDIYFPRFFHNPPVEKTNQQNGVLVNHFYTGSNIIFSAPIKAVELDQDGVLRLKWWKQNDILKEKKVDLKTEKRREAVRLCLTTFNTDDLGLVEAEFMLKDEDYGSSPSGFYFEITADSGYVLLFNRNEAAFGTMKKNGSDLALTASISRDLEFSKNSVARIIFKRDMIEAYIDDYFIIAKRIKWSGRIGFTGMSGKAAAWVHD